MWCVNIEATVVQQGEMYNRQLEIWVQVSLETVVYVKIQGVENHTETEFRGRIWGNTNKDQEKKDNLVVFQQSRKGKNFENRGISSVRLHKDIKSDQKWINLSGIDNLRIHQLPRGMHLSRGGGVRIEIARMKWKQ